MSTNSTNGTRVYIPTPLRLYTGNATAVTVAGGTVGEALADLVAHADKITPTDCAKFLEGLAQPGFLEEFEGQFGASASKANSTNTASTLLSDFVWLPLMWKSEASCALWAQPMAAVRAPATLSPCTRRW